MTSLAMRKNAPTLFQFLKMSIVPLLFTDDVSPLLPSPSPDDKPEPEDDSSLITDKLRSQSQCNFWLFSKITKLYI